MTTLDIEETQRKLGVRLGDKFHVTEVVDVRDKNDMIVTRFLPDFEYTVTKRSLPDVLKYLSDGRAKQGRNPALAKGGVKVNQASGRVRT